MLREIEISYALVAHVAVAENQLSATWLLPTSKTDPRALGVSRSWDCCCHLRRLSLVCPVHALLRQIGRVEQLAEQLGLDADQLPLFPTPRGDNDH